MIAKIKLKNKKQKAQAAITDALYFLVIIVTLCVLLFRYSSTYGSRIEQGLGDLYFKEYANSAMKTIFYTSVPLNFDLNLDQENIEIDYLIVSVKQDFFADGQIGASEDINIMNLSPPNSRDIAKFNLYSTIKAIMNPIDSYDYVFYLYNEDDTQRLFNFFMLKKTSFEEMDNTEGDYKYQKYYNVTGNKYYLCSPDLPEEVVNVISKGNKIFSSSVPLYFKKKGGESNTINATFAIWPGTSDITDSDLDILNCNVIESIDYEN